MPPPAGRDVARWLLDCGEVRGRIGRAVGRGVGSATAAAFTLSRPQTTSSKARRYRDATVLRRTVFVFTPSPRSPCRWRTCFTLEPLERAPGDIGVQARPLAFHFALDLTGFYRAAADDAGSASAPLGLGHAIDRAHAALGQLGTDLPLQCVVGSAGSLPPGCCSGLLVHDVRFIRHPEPSTRLPAAACIVRTGRIKPDGRHCLPNRLQPSGHRSACLLDLGPLGPGLPRA